MVRKGYRFKRNRHLAFRDADGVNDKTVDGKVISENYVVIVRAKDCPVTRVEVDEHGRETQYIDPNGVKHLPVLYHSRTNFIYGPKQKHETMRGVEYHPIYWVEDAIVYQGRSYTEPEE
jgi:hypothetical protein